MTRSRPQRKVPRQVVRKTSHSQSPTLSPSWLLGGLSLVTILYVAFPRTIFGLPPSLIFSALQDQQVRESLFAGDSYALRNRLKALGVEDKANKHFEEEFSDDREREQFLDQQFRDATGYYNRSEYEEGKDGDLKIVK